MYDQEKYIKYKHLHRMSWKRRQQRNRDWTDDDKKRRGCSYCGYNKFAGALHYHHEHDDKSINVSRLCSQGRSLDLVQEEVSKCIVVCANCHSEIHHCRVV